MQLWVDKNKRVDQQEEIGSSKIFLSFRSISRIWSSQEGKYPTETPRKLKKELGSPPCIPWTTWPRSKRRNETVSILHSVSSVPFGNDDNGRQGKRLFRPRFRIKRALHDDLFPRLLSFPLELANKVKDGRENRAFLLSSNYVTEQIKHRALLRRQESIRNAVISLLSGAQFLCDWIGKF